MKKLTLQECNIAPIENLRIIAMVEVPEMKETVNDTNRKLIRARWMLQASRTIPQIRRVLVRDTEYIDLDTQETFCLDNFIVLFEKSFSEYFAEGSFRFEEEYGKIKLKTFMPMKDMEKEIERAMSDVMYVARKKFDKLYSRQTRASKLTKEERKLLRQKTRKKANVR